MNNPGIYPGDKRSWRLARALAREVVGLRPPFVRCPLLPALKDGVSLPKSKKMQIGRRRLLGAHSFYERTEELIRMKKEKIYCFLWSSVDMPGIFNFTRTGIRFFLVQIQTDFNAPTNTGFHWKIYMSIK